MRLSKNDKNRLPSILDGCCHGRANNEGRMIISVDFLMREVILKMRNAHSARLWFTSNSQRD